ncbi:MAG: hypothetical protein Q8891_00050 [Bacteroidota bacterium]|nr:hypothetical protein [Bacteroidota bacterium]
MKKYLKLTALFIFLSGNLLFAQQTQVLLLPTIHNAHETNPRYSFQNLLKIIDNFKPDLIAIEIRQEDMHQHDTLYLNTFYRPDMILVKDQFPAIPKVGIDFEGNDMVGKTLPMNYRKDTTTINGKAGLINRAIKSDPGFMSAYKGSGIAELENKRLALIASASAQELIDGPFDSYSNLMAAKLDSLRALNPEYAQFQISSSYRDQRLADNVKEVILKNPGKRIIVLSGVNHHGLYVQVMSKMTGVHFITRVNDR